MALIECPKCGKQISDKATVCPSCGYEPEVKETHEEQLLCPECGNIISEEDEICKNCGYLILKNSSSADYIQKVEVASIKIPKISKKKRIAIIVSIVLVVVILAGIVLGVYTSRKNASEEYRGNMSLATSTMLLGAAKAESSAGLIHDVWYNTIYKKSDPETNEFTQNRYGSYNSDFNTSLAALMADDDFQNDITYIKESQVLVNGIMSELVNPPDEYVAAYDKLQELYDSYLELTNLAVNPTGNLTSYTSSYNSADTAVVNAYKAMQQYVDVD